jgi:hypothetical protein
MAGIRFIAQTTEQALSASTAKSLISVVAPANRRVKILGWGVYFDGIDTTILETAADTTTKPSVEVVLTTGTSAGTFTDTLGAKDTHGSLTEMSGLGATIQSTAKTTVSIEPTATGVFDMAEVDQTNGETFYFKEGQEPIINGGSFAAIECTSPQNLNARAKIICEE